MKKRRIYKKKNNLHFIIHYMYTFKKKCMLLTGKCRNKVCVQCLVKVCRNKLNLCSCFAPQLRMKHL